ncbi:hypothetical protein [Synechococcus sp. EJ6-Ellesmere]|uniref:hypothetical protein n=1 Tax=Synechococcus sp. EJ6-Ellesmere TaxID=2823734 RepID=UPI0020CBD5C3|nr:hypothetical protein [Synechococcus sp. EJ6-Ellesmere]MCP9824508.1 hypothetical protein [Synechococcus sp. EJ6-Ellesmere]
MTTTTTTAAKTRTKATPDPWIVELTTAPHWRWKLTVPRAVLAQHGHHTIAALLAQHGAHPVCLEQFAMGRCAWVALGSMSAASAAAGALRGFQP